MVIVHPPADTGNPDCPAYLRSVSGLLFNLTQPLSDGDEILKKMANGLIDEAHDNYMLAPCAGEADRSDWRPERGCES